MIFAEPVIITACEFLEQNASSSSQAVSLLGYVFSGCVYSYSLSNFNYERSSSSKIAITSLVRICPHVVNHVVVNSIWLFDDALLHYRSMIIFRLNNLDSKV